MSFRFQDLPSELRLKIYPLNHALQLPFDNSLPALLVALIPKQALFNEALEIYRRINYSLSTDISGTPQEEAFKGLRLSRLLQIRHLKLVWLSIPGEFSEGNTFNMFTLKAHKVLLKNNFETLTFVFERHSLHHHSTLLLEFLMKSSLVGVTKVILRSDGARDLKEVKSVMGAVCGVDGLLIKQKTHECGEDSWEQEVWCWYAWSLSLVSTVTSYRQNLTSDGKAIILEDGYLQKVESVAIGVGCSPPLN